MMRKTIWTAGASLLGIALWLGAQQAASNQRKPLADLMPSNALLYLEAKNFAPLLASWNASPEKKTWLQSGNYQSFIRTKLALRLEEVQKAYADGIGVNPNAVLLENIAGGESAVAVYDIGKLELLYATRLPAARLADNLLMQARTKFQTRNSAGQTYYVKSTSDGTIAFAVAPGDLLLAGTREDLVAGALQLIASSNRSSIRSERWYTDAVAKAQTSAAPDLRLVVNLERTVRTPHFRSYWIQQNITDLKQYYASISDLDMSQQGAWTERRVLLRAEPSASPVDESAVAQLVRLLPADAGFRQAWAKPSRTEVEAMLEETVTPRTRAARVNPENERAPGESVVYSAGSEDDLDERIDSEAEAAQSANAALPITRLAATAELDAIGRGGSTRLNADGVYVSIDAATVLLAKTNWDENTVKAAAQASVEQTTAARSLTWTRRGPVWELSGLRPLQLWIDGRTLVISNSASLADRIAARTSTAQPLTGAYIASYRHATENANYARMMRLIDFPSIPTGEARAPMLFSENIGGIGAVLARVESVTLESKDEGAIVRQQVVYRRKL
jgi:hypothetical protein